MDVRVGRLTGVYKNMSRGVVALVFLCTPLGEPDEESSEATAVSWVPLKSVADLMAPAYAVRIFDALDDDPVIARIHDGRHLIASRSSL